MEELIRDYAIIDHIGEIDCNMLTPIYNEAYKRAAEDGFHTNKWDPENNVFTMKTVAHKMSPYAKEVSFAMKDRARRTKEPKKVYLICERITDSIEYNANLWSERQRKVMLNEDNYYYDWIQLEILPTIPEYCYYGEELSVARRIAIKWGKALGWSFSAPLIIDQHLSEPDTYIRNKNIQPNKYINYEVREVERDNIVTKIPYDSFYTSNDTIADRFDEKQEILKDHNKKRKNSPFKKPITYRIEKRIFSDYNDFSKISTKGETFRKRLQIAPEKECMDFYIYYMWLRGYDVETFPNGRTKYFYTEGGKEKASVVKGTPKFIKSKDENRYDMIEEHLEPDYKICPECGSPYRERSNPDYRFNIPVIECDYCPTLIPVEDIVVGEFYDDTYNAKNSRMGTPEEEIEDIYLTDIEQEEDIDEEYLF